MISSWVDGADDHPEFSIHCLPYGVFSTPEKSPRVGVAISNQVLDLAAVSESGLFEGADEKSSLQWSNIFEHGDLGRFMGLSKPSWTAIRTRLYDILARGDSTEEMKLRVGDCLHPMDEVTMHFPSHVGDYTVFEDSSPSMCPKGMSVRTSTLKLSGSVVHRPNGPIALHEGDLSNASIYATSRALQCIPQVGYFVGGDADLLGNPITVSNASDFIFGVNLSSRWVAKDVHAWDESQGSVISNVGTIMSPWVVPMQALVPFECEPLVEPEDEEDVASKEGIITMGPTPAIQLLNYMVDSNPMRHDMKLTVTMSELDGDNEEVLCHANPRNHKWSVAQLLCHMTVTGVPMRAGDLIGVGCMPLVDKSDSEQVESAREGQLLGGGGPLFYEDGNRVHLRCSCVKSPEKPQVKGKVNCLSVGDAMTIGCGHCAMTVLGPKLCGPPPPPPPPPQHESQGAEAQGLFDTPGWLNCFAVPQKKE